MALLFLIFAAAMATGTFIESWYDTATARILIYNAWWFELIMLFMVVNFIGNIFKYKLLQISKWPVLLLHISWVLIIAGAFITRYISYEGILPIKEGQTENQIYSEKTFLTLYVDGEIQGEPRRKVLETDIIASEYGVASSFWWKKLPWNDDFNGNEFQVSFAGFIKGAKEGFIPDKSGHKYLKVVASTAGERQDHFIKEGGILKIENMLFTFNNTTEAAINIKYDGKAYFVVSPYHGSYVRMSDQSRGLVIKDSMQLLQFRSLYNIADTNFVIPDKIQTGNIDVKAIPKNETNANDIDALILDIKYNGKEEQIKLLGGKGIATPMKSITIGDLDFRFTYASKKIPLPFEIKLNDFIANKYPGTENAYSSFMSKISVFDQRPFDYDIYMNHVLDHRGYRFFQSSFFPDEKGTILSVNHDLVGTWTTYTGYFMLYLGLLGILFFGNTRFKSLAKTLDKMKSNKTKTALVLLFLFGLQSYSSFAVAPRKDLTEPKNEVRISDENTTIHNTTIKKIHAAKFGKLIIQDDGGRMKPINTYASELLRKLYKHDEFQGLDANQFLLSILQNPDLWYQTKFIYINGKNDSIRKIINIPKNQKYAKPKDFFDEAGFFKLSPYLKEAFKTNNPNQFQKTFKEYALKLALLKRAFNKGIIRIFPIPHDKNNKWISLSELKNENFISRDSAYFNFVDKEFQNYLQALKKANKTDNYKEADSLLNNMKVFQLKYGSKIIPTEKKVEAELLYNRINIFEKLLVYYMMAGVFMFLFKIIEIFFNGRILSLLIKLCKISIHFLFLIQTLGLALRWYISGHAPWSDAYESVIYVAWATMAIGLLFGRKSEMTLAMTAFVTAIILFGAHMNWLDPQIANLTPVLNSYWLIIHVAVIVGSYGPLTLGMILGVTSMVLMLLLTKKNKHKIAIQLKELTLVNELTLTVGLIMLTIGNFLGGQWANESWGRYWGWDPKETWALISIMIYAFVLHMRLVPGLRGLWTFNFASVVAFASIMMTYFGVNFYLSGLHSYASGDKVITPNFVFVLIAFVLSLGLFSLWRYKKTFQENQ
jgi:cytochrome c-type biogenesis protein CcsB